MLQIDVNACYERIADSIIKTPLVESAVLSDLMGKKVYLKLESMQRTGAFKFRGALNYYRKMPASLLAKGIVTASSGNHGLGMSLSAKMMGVSCTVVMPCHTPVIKQNKAKAYGATVILKGSCYDQAREYAHELAEQEGKSYVPSFNHPAIIEGQGTILTEILQDISAPDMILSPVGGGGLLSGLLLAKEEAKIKTTIMGVEAAGAACMQAALAAGKIVSLSNARTIADGIFVKKVGNLTYEVVRRFQPPMYAVNDEAILAAQKLLLKQNKLVVETASACTVAALLQMQIPEEVQTIVCLITGGNVDMKDIKALL